MILKRNIVFLLCLFYSITGISQTSILDSLKLRLIQSKIESEKLEILNDICIEYIFEENFDSAFKYSLKSSEYISKTDDQKIISLHYNILGNIYFYQENLPEALSANFQALKIREKLKDKKSIANSYNNIGNVYYKMDSLDKALNFHFKALKIRRVLKDTINLSFSFNNLGNAYTKKKEFDLALKYHNASLKIKEIINDSLEISNSILNIGSVYLEQGEYSKALIEFNRALTIKEKIQDNIGLSLVLCNYSITYSKLKDYNKSVEYDLKALTLSKDLNDIESILDIHSRLSETYQSIGNFESSFIHYKKYIKLKDSVFNEENIKKAVQVQLLYDFEKQTEASLLEQNKKDTIAKMESDRQKSILIFISIAFIIVMILSIFLFKNYQDKKRINKIIVEQKIETERQKNLVEEKNRDVTDSILYAKRIQEAILPSHDIIKAKFPDSFVFYQPKDIVAGDFYWISDALTKYKESFSMVALADCTGHGVPGALMSVIGNNYLRLCEHEPTVNRPSEALDFINKGVSRTLRQEYQNSSIKDGMDMVFVAIDYHSKMLHFAGAKNSIYIIRNKVLAEYKGDRHPIGAYIGEEMKKFTNHTIPFEKGDCLYLFTDGIIDQFGGPEYKKFNSTRFKRILVENSELTMKEQNEKLINQFQEWKGERDQIDDICVIGIRI